jgi:hypothetical protein
MMPKKYVVATSMKEAKELVEMMGYVDERDAVDLLRSIKEASAETFHEGLTGESYSVFEVELPDGEEPVF